ncbi:retrovirus-related pol polyprotein from transposon 17.6 [Tanacetum coccineum]
MTQATRNKFEELYTSANEELYPGCDYVTRSTYHIALYISAYLKAKGRLTDSIFNEMLEFFQNVFPISKGFKLPPSYYAIEKTFKTIGLGYESIHACEHDCCLFRGDNNKDLDFCPVCNTSRWKDSNTPGKKVPKKVLCYFPIIPRLQCLYKSSHTTKDMIWHATGKCMEPGKMQHPVDGGAWKKFDHTSKDMIWHATGKCTEPDKMQHPVDGGAWKKFDTKYPDFAKEPRNIRLWLAADGFQTFWQPYLKPYNMRSVILTTYNMPPWLCMKESSFILTLLIPGPKSLGKDIDVYLRPLIEDLKVLWYRKGVETIDCFRPEVQYESDAYVGHIRFLKKPHKWRHSLEFIGETDNKDPPKEFDRDVILAQLDRLPTREGDSGWWGEIEVKYGVIGMVRNVEEVLVRVGVFVYSGDERRTTQNSGICSPGPEEEMYYGQLQEILEFKYLLFKVALFRVK